MSERLEAYKAQLERNKEYEERVIRESAEEAESIEKVENDLLSRKERFQENKLAYDNYINSVRSMLLTEAISSITLESLGEYITDDSKHIVKNLVNKFVKENGVYNILSNTQKTYSIEAVKSLVNKYTTIITEKCDKDNKETFKVDKEDKVKFLDELNDEKDIENVKQAIALRVSNAEEEFITANIDDKLDINNIIQDTKNRIESTKTDMTTDDETKDEIAKEATNLSKQRIDNIRENRKRSIFNQMVINLSESVIKDENIRNEFMTDSGQLNMDKIVESTKCFYGFLETLNTMKLENVNEEYIENVLNDMK